MREVFFDLAEGGVEGLGEGGLRQLGRQLAVAVVLAQPHQLSAELHPLVPIADQLLQDVLHVFLEDVLCVNESAGIADFPLKQTPNFLLVLKHRTHLLFREVGNRKQCVHEALLGLEQLLCLLHGNPAVALGLLSSAYAEGDEVLGDVDVGVGDDVLSVLS